MSALLFYFFILLVWGDHAQLSYRPTIACLLYSFHFFSKEPWNYVELITDLVVFFADMGYKVSLRLHDYVDRRVKDIFKSNLAAYSENIGNSSIRILNIKH